MSEKTVQRCKNCERLVFERKIGGKLFTMVKIKLTPEQIKRNKKVSKRLGVPMAKYKLRLHSCDYLV